VSLHKHHSLLFFPPSPPPRLRARLSPPRRSPATGTPRPPAPRPASRCPPHSSPARTTPRVRRKRWGSNTARTATITRAWRITPRRWSFWASRADVPFLGNTLRSRDRIQKQARDRKQFRLFQQEGVVTLVAFDLGEAD